MTENKYLVKKAEKRLKENATMSQVMRGAKYTAEAGCYNIEVREREILPHKWELNTDPRWAWNTFEYRIMQPKLIELALLQGSSGQIYSAEIVCPDYEPPIGSTILARATFTIKPDKVRVSIRNLRNVEAEVADNLDDL